MKIIFVLLTCILLVIQPLSARSRIEMSLHWDALASQIIDSKVTVSTLSQGVAQGRVVRVGPQDLQLRVGKTVQAIPRGQVTAIRLTRYEGGARKTGLKVGIGVGLAAGLIIAASIGLNETSGDTKAENTAKAVGGWLGAWGGSAAAGYLIGRWVDRQDVTITVLQ